MREKYALRRKRYTRMFLLLTLFSFKKQIVYRASFFIALTAKCIRIAIYFFLFESLFLFTDMLGGFSREEVIVHFLTAFSIFLVSSAIFQRNLVFHLSRYIKQGSLDGMLTKPLHPLFFVSCSESDLYDLVSAIPIIGIVAYAISHVENATVGSILLYIVACCISVAFVFGISVLLSSLSFKTVETTGIGRILHALFKSAQYPVGAYGAGWGAVFSLVFPISIIATFPTHVLVQSVTLGELAHALLYTGVLVVGSVYVWMKALQTYSSASS